MLQVPEAAKIAHRCFQPLIGWLTTDKCTFSAGIRKRRPRRPRIPFMRKIRELRDGARYHVTSRINRQEMSFAPESIKVLFLDIVERAKRKYGFSVENFCIMDDHFHMIIRPSSSCGLPKIMQWIKSMFSVTYNRINGALGIFPGYWVT